MFYDKSGVSGERDKLPFLGLKDKELLDLNGSEAAEHALTLSAVQIPKKGISIDVSQIE